LKSLARKWIHFWFSLKTIMLGSIKIHGIIFVESMEVLLFSWKLNFWSF